MRRTHSPAEGIDDHQFLLPPDAERTARELKRAAGLEASDRYWRGQVWRLLLRCYGLWTVGVILFALSWLVEGRLAGQIVFLTGILIGYCGPLIAGYVFWTRHGH